VKEKESFRELKRVKNYVESIKFQKMKMGPSRFE
jgi:hypothetical protein